MLEPPLGRAGASAMALRKELLKSIWYAFTALDVEKSGKVSKSQLKVRSAGAGGGQQTCAAIHLGARGCLGGTQLSPGAEHCCRVTGHHGQPAGWMLLPTMGLVRLVKCHRAPAHLSLSLVGGGGSGIMGFCWP